MSRGSKWSFTYLTYIDVFVYRSLAVFWHSSFYPVWAKLLAVCVEWDSF